MQHEKRKEKREEMNGVKEGKFLSFYLDNGKAVKYDLSTGEMIGVKGEPVKSLGVRFSNLSMTDMINSVNPKEYANFLRFVSYREPRISNFGTLLKRAKGWSRFEQVFAQGAKISIHYNGLVPEQNFINFCKKYRVNDDIQSFNRTCKVNSKLKFMATFSHPSAL